MTLIASAVMQNRWTDERKVVSVASAAPLVRKPERVFDLDGQKYKNDEWDITLIIENDVVNMTVEDAAAFLLSKVGTLADWRTKGFGPKFVKAGRRIIYRRHWIEEWLESRAVTTTEQARNLDNVHQDVSATNDDLAEEPES